MQQRIRSYPPILLHTMFHDDPKFEEYRKVEFSTLFFFADEIKSLGNKAYQKGEFYLALDYYEQVSLYKFNLLRQCLSLFNWLEVKDSPDAQQKRKLKMFGREPIILTDEKVFNMFKPIENDPLLNDELLEKDNRRKRTFYP